MNRTLDAVTVAALAERLETAELEARAVVKITDDHPDMSFADAYAVQDAIRARKEGRGTAIVGLKMGLTSRAKMRQMGVQTPIRGFLTDYGAVAENDAINCDALIHPKVEAEVAFVTRAELKGPGCHVGDVLAATEFVMPALEVIDSRYENFRFDLVSVIADNTSAARFVTGSRMAAPSEIDLRNMGVVMERNGEVIELGAGAAVLGHPATSVAMLANMLAAHGQVIPAGTFVLTGGITKAVLVEPGDVITARYQGLGTVTTRFA